MNADGEIIKRLFTGVMAFIYLAGIFGPSSVYIAHDMHHLMSHTLYKHFLHQYEHFKGIAHEHNTSGHGHSHNDMIDFALHQLEKDKGRHQDREAPGTISSFKYNEHVKGQYINMRPSYVLTEPHRIFDVSRGSLTDQKPPTPPPRNC